MTLTAQPLRELDPHDPGPAVDHVDPPSTFLPLTLLTSLLALFLLSLLLYSDSHLSPPSLIFPAATVFHPSLVSSPPLSLAILRITHTFLLIPP